MTKRQFSKFKRVFKTQQKVLSLGEYTVKFRLKKMSDAWAFIESDAEGCIATVSVSDGKEWTDEQIETTAKHEALHLLLARYNEIARRRFANEDELHHEEEKVVCILEGQLK